MLRWNEVTWYSKLGAAIVIFGVLPALSFYIGVQYDQVMTLEKSVPKAPVVTIKRTHKTIQPLPAPAEDPSQPRKGTVAWEQVVQQLSECKVFSIAVIEYRPRLASIKLKDDTREFVSNAPDFDATMAAQASFTATCGQVAVDHEIGLEP